VAEHVRESMIAALLVVLYDDEVLGGDPSERQRQLWEEATGAEKQAVLCELWRFWVEGVRR
jgi:hypothetical protein